jgi:PrtD family type I secretion system ABC transporter
MSQTMTNQWLVSRQQALSTSIAAADSGGGLAIITKTVRMLLQSAVLALGALLVLEGQLTGGAIIAGSTLLGRALSPVEQLVGHWALFQRAFVAWRDLTRLLAAVPPDTKRMHLPRPEPRLEVKDLTIVPPGEQSPILRGVSLAATAGDAIAVIGPSASGKSTLARALAGVWPATRGEIRLAGADLPQYDRDHLGAYLGYLPQDVLLFTGTVAENVSRFDPTATPEAIVDAARKAAAHELILSLPQGYDTVLTEGGGRISGGQRQRIGLARAFYGDPSILILDEPNSSLDDPGVQALNQAISTARADGKIVLIMSHRPSALAECNLVLILDGGQMRGFGPRDEVLNRFVKNIPAAVTPHRGTA